MFSEHLLSMAPSESQFFIKNHQFSAAFDQYFIQS